MQKRGMILVVVLLLAGPVFAQDLTGLWTGNDGGTYYLRQAGDRIFWLGESGDGGRTWTNVATGKISGDRIILDWGDVPKGGIRNSGILVLRVEGDRLVRIEGTGGFGGSEWRRGGPPVVAGAEPEGVLVGTLIVPSDKPVKVESNSVLERGRWYVIEASGVWNAWGDTRDGIDAVWCYVEWRCGKQGLVWDQLRIDGKGMTEIAGNPIPYNPEHVYRVRYMGQGKRVEFFIADTIGSSGDNIGALTVKIFQ